MKKKWFENWKVEEKPLRTRDDKTQVGLYVKVKLPNSANGKKEWSHLFMNSEKDKAHELTNILMSAFDQIQKDNA
jgi:hypothetical protein